MAWHRTSRQSRGYDAQWDKLRKVILLRDNYLCQCPDCKRLNRIRSATHVDHVVPKAKGGTNDPSNLRSLNKVCHERITLLQFGKKPADKPTIGADGWPVNEVDS